MDDKTIMWVGSCLPDEVYLHDEHEHEHEDSCSWVSCLPEGQELHWEWQDDDFYASDNQGVFWSWAETKTWLDCQDCLLAQPSEATQNQEIFATFEHKMRTSRRLALNTAKHLARGYYPMSMFKGKGKGRGSGFPKGKGSFQTKGKGSPSLSAALTVTGKGASCSGPQKPGCFICGSKEHDFRTCPERGVQPASGKEVIRLRVLGTSSTRLCTW